MNNHADVSARVKKLSMTHMVIDICDDEDANLLLHFEQAVQFIRTALAANGKVLVHCHAGVSRSASVSVPFPCSSIDSGRDVLKTLSGHTQVVAAYLMAVELLDAKAALATLQSVYPLACPNEGMLTLSQNSPPESFPGIRLWD